MTAWLGEIDVTITTPDDAFDRVADALVDRLAPRLAQRVTNATTPDAWMDSREAVAYLGLSSLHALHKLTSARLIPLSQERDGGRCYFRRADLDAWRESQRRGKAV